MSTLSLCVICKNEEKNIVNLLESVKGDLFDEVVITDTGSTDKTLPTLAEYQKSNKFKSFKTEHFPWVHDFSAARNYSFSKATSEYIMWLDSDDVILAEDYKKLVKLKETLNNAPIWLCKYEYAHDEFGKSICSFYRERIVRRDLNLQWQEPIHEYLPLVAHYIKTDIEVHHYKIHVSSQRNITLLEKIVEKNPNAARNVFYLGKEYFDCGQTDKGYETLCRFVEMPDAWSENKFSAYVRMSSYRKNRKEFSGAFQHAHQAVAVDPLKAEVYCLLGDLCMEQRNLLGATHWYTIASNMGRSEDSLDVVEPKYYTWLPHLQLCLIYNERGDVSKAAIHNEIALTFRAEDPRLLNNKKIFKEHLKHLYPRHLFTTGESYYAPWAKEDHKEMKEEKVRARFDKYIGWYAPNFIDAGTIRIRVLNVAKKLKDLGYKSELYTQENEDKYDIIVAGKSYSPADLTLVQKWKSKGKKVICDLSEDILQFPFVKEILSECNMVVCCSEELRKRVLPVNTNAILIEDATEFEV